jgi:hypothetical protein
VLRDVLPRVAIVSSVVAVVCTRKEAKKERRNKRLRRDEILDLVKGIDMNSTKLVHVDFDLILATILLTFGSYRRAPQAR